MEETGKLIKLPCDIGSKVYTIYRFLDEGAWEIEEHKIRLEDLEHIGKTVFLTREAAAAERRMKLKRLCKNCIHCKGKQVGDISSVYWCDISKKGSNGQKLGVQPWRDSPHPKCPVKKKER